MESMHGKSHLFKWRWGLASCWLVAFIGIAFTPVQAGSLKITTASAVGERGEVRLTLTLENAGSEPLTRVHPMFHFHHSYSMMPKVAGLAPGGRVTMENREHPPVVRPGRYPIAVMVHYRDDAGEERTALHTDSFHYQEPVVSEIGGEIRATEKDGGSMLSVHIKNHSASFKNVQMMLLAPPEVVVENFKGMIGLTLRGGEEKRFEVPVRRAPGSRDGDYPIHLTVEYGEMLTHFTGEINGRVRFGPLGVALLPQVAAVALLLSFVYFLYRRRRGWATLAV